MGQAEFAGDEIEDGDQVNRGPIAPGLALDRAEDAIETFHEGVGQAPLPVG